MDRKFRIGIIGCGQISSIYSDNLKTYPFLEVAACADLEPERASRLAEQKGIPKALPVEQLLRDPDIDLVLNLTIPAAHARLNLAALEAGKHVYCEKPLAVRLEDGRRVVETARARGLRVGCAPDTVLGAGIQTCRKLIDDGWIGRPVAANAFMLGHGPESWHANPFFFYQEGGGPMFDMGPYYLTALLTLLGPVRRVAGMATKSFPERLATSSHHFGVRIPVEVATHVAGLLEFAGGAAVTLITSFDVWGSRLPNIEIHGTEGSLSVPDPNGFGGQVLLRRAGSKEWGEIPHSHGYAGNSRGVGVADMARAILVGRPHRANGDLALHALEIMHALHRSWDEKAYVELAGPAERPAPMAMGLPERMLD